MALRILLYVLLFLFVLIESTVLSFPFVLVMAVLIFLLFPGIRTLIVIFMAACALDAVRMHNIGLTPLCIFVVIFLLNFNDKLFDIRDYAYIAAVIILGAIVYSILMQYHISFLILGVITGLLFLGGTLFVRNKFAKTS